MHLNKILEQIKRHQSPSEAIDKLSTALEKHEGSLLEKGFTILKSELAANMYEAINGLHFDYDLFRLLQSSRCYDWQRKYQTLRRIGKSLAM